MGRLLPLEKSEVGLVEGLLVFAHVPPPHHGQSQMVEDDLAILREEYGERIHHVDARWSQSADEIGGSSWKKFFLIFRYLREALLIRWKKGVTTLYYVPGPVKWSAVLRDFIVLTLLRPCFRKTVFHWHAIGQGEWAQGSERVRLPGPAWLSGVMALLSRWALRRPELSLLVSASSDRDARALGSEEIEVVWNGIPDIAGENYVRPESIGPVKRLLFFSRGTAEKGLLDALAAVERCAVEQGWSAGEYSLTMAGGVAAEIEGEVEELRVRCEKRGVKVERRDFVVGDEKAELFKEHDLLIFPSHWESFGLVIVEAMSFDLPVVAAASDGAVGVLGSDYPFLAEPGDVADLARVIGCFLTHKPSEVARCCGRGLFLEKFTVDRHRKALLNAI